MSGPTFDEFKAKVAALLRGIQFKHVEQKCPSCYAYDWDGHYDDCALAALLKEAEA